MTDANNGGTPPQGQGDALPPVPPVPPLPQAPAAPPAPATPPAPPVAGAYPPPPAPPLPTAPLAPSAVAPTSPSAAASLPFAALLSWLVHAAVILGGVVVSGGVLLMLLVLGASDGSDMQELFRAVEAHPEALVTALLTLMGFSVGGYLSFEGSLTVLGIEGAVSVLPLTFTLFLMGVAAWWGVRAERRTRLGSAPIRLLWAVASGLVASLVVLLISVLGAVRVAGSGPSFTLSSAGWQIPVYGTVLLGLAAFLGREAAARVPEGSWIATFGALLARTPRAARELLQWGLLGAIVFGVIGVVVVLLQPASAGPLGARIATLLAILPDVPAVMVAFTHMGGIDFAHPYGGEVLHIVTDGGLWWWLGFVAAILVAVVAAVRIGTRRPRGARRDVRDAAMLPLLTLVAWLLVAFVFVALRVEIGSVSGFGAGGIAVDMRIAWWTALVMAVWAILIEVGAVVLPTFFARLSPQLHRVVAGRAATDAWLADGVAQVAELPAAPAAGGGADVSVAASASSTTPAGAPAPLSPAAKRGIVWSLVGIGAVAVVGIGGTVAINVINSTQRSPVVVVKSYLDAIARGDAATANDLVDPGVGSGERQFLTNEVLGSAVERIVVNDVRSMGSYGDGAMVQAEYSLDGERHTEMFQVKKGDPEMLVLDTWILDDPLVVKAPVRLSGDGSATIGGIAIPANGALEYAALYPGVYDVVPSNSKYLAAEPARIVAAGFAARIVSVEFEPTPALASDIEAFVRAKLDECAESTEAEPVGCPFRAYVWGTDEPKVTWRVERYPEVRVSPHSRSFSGSGGVVVAEFDRKGFDGEVEKETQQRSIWLAGEYTIEGDTLDIALR